MNTFSEYYKENVVPNLMDQFKYKTPMEVPRLGKITINMGLGSAVNDKKILETSAGELTQISGQKAILTYAKKSIAHIQLREGMPIGVAVTLRGYKMWEFYDRFIQVAVPRIRDFRGFSKKSFDGKGNYTLGLNEQLVFCLLYTSDAADE